MGRSPPAAGICCAGILLVIYASTMAPALTWAHYGADGGDLVRAVARGSIPHPPGFPTYLLLGDLFIRLPWGNPAGRLNLMSAVMAAGAGGLAAGAVGSLLRSGSHDLPVAVAAGLSLGLAPLFWSQALITEVYAAAACFAALVMVLALGEAPAWALGLAWGLGTGAHPTLLFLAPLVAWRAWGRPAGFVARVALAALLGWGSVYGPVLWLRGWLGAPSPWGDVSSPAGWWALVSGRLYRGYLFALPPPAWPQRLLAWAGLMARQFTPLGAALAGLGLGRLGERSRGLALGTALAFGGFSLYAVGYDTADSLVYLVPALPLGALWLGMGLERAARWLGRHRPVGAWLLLLLPLAQALFFWGKVDVSAEREAMAWARDVLRRAPPQAAILTGQDAHTFTLWYARDVLGQRPDVVVLDRDMWGHGPYRRMMSSALGIGSVEDTLSAEGGVRRAGRPIFISMAEPAIE